MNTHTFLHLKIPLKPYYEISRGPSTKFNESIHIENKNTGKCLNLHLCKIREQVDVVLYSPHKKNDNDLKFLFTSKNITEKDIPLQILE